MKHVLLVSALVAASTAAAFAQSDQPGGGVPPGGQGTAATDAAPQAPTGTGRIPGAPAPSGQASVSACRPMIVPFGTRGTIEANVNVSTRLQFPGTVRRVEVSTPALWDATYAEHSAWVRPKTTVALAGQTGLSVFLENGRTYDFLVNASPTVPASCVLVVEPPKPVAAQSAPAAAPQQVPRTPEEAAGAAGDREAAAARARAASAAATRRRASEDARLAERFAAMRRQVEQQAMDRIKQFQHSIDTNYTWGRSGRGDRHLVQAVYDDGRFTYVRIKTDAFGVPAITGRVNGSDTLLQYTYDDLTGVFTIQGLFDKLNLSLGTHSIPIERGG